MNGKPISHRPDRRDFLRLGTLGAAGISLPELLRSRRLSAADHPKPSAKNCILVWLDGGPSHLDMFDPKPDAPVEIRGPIGSIATSIPGVRLGECLPQTARIMDKLAIIRSMTSPLGEHHFGTHYLMTGYRPSPALEYPAFGSTLVAMRDRQGVLPPNIAVPSFTDNISGNGYLPDWTAPFSIGTRPDRPDYRVRDLDFYPGLSLDRLSRRRDMVSAMDRFSASGDQVFNSGDSDLERAYQLIASPDAKAAFDLTDEPEQLRSRYGGGGADGVGQACLLARRLVQRGVPFVTVHSGGWDTHQDIGSLKSRYPGDQGAHLPSLDRAISGLITDLDDRGMLDETLVVVMGEFGRTPKINPSGGRDHWPNVFSVALAGGGVRGGQVIGRSDRLAEFPDERPVTPSDLAATVYRLLGIDPAAELKTGDGRPVRIASDQARVIGELVG